MTEKVSLEKIMKESIFPVGGENVNYAQYFDGKSYLNMISLEQVIIGNVTFEAGCRNHWHIHHAKSGGGQILLVTYGRGWYQEFGKTAQALKPGDVVHIPAGVKHWHGAAKDSAFQHLAVEVAGVETSNEWCEPVDEKDYNALEWK
ncbi:MAG: cupin domain-containing protein [Selenomonadaceae bacterium]|nr:cupin domain-containing protein [Selenomonadaceae bacterium]